jgi:putative FmdB family regulatory protein
MPIYEYECRGCGRRFEYLVRPSAAAADNSPACPSCHSQDLEKLLSSFAVSSAGTKQLHLQDGRKRGQKERLDTKHAEIEAIEHHH